MSSGPATLAQMIGSVPELWTLTVSLHSRTPIFARFLVMLI